MRVGQKLTPPSACWPDWMIAVELAARMGSDLGVGSATELWDEIERLAPSHSGLTRAVLDSPAARDGIVVPLKATRVSIGRGSGSEGHRPLRPDGNAWHRVGRGSGSPISRVGNAEQPGGDGPEDGGGSDGQPDGQHDGQRADDQDLKSSKPGLIERDLASRENVVVARPAEGTLRLVTPRRLYDHGVQVAESPSLAALVAPLVAKMNPADLEARGISSGTAVRLTADGTNGTAGSDGTAGSHDSAGSDASGLQRSRSRWSQTRGFPPG